MDALQGPAANKKKEEESKIKARRVDRFHIVNFLPRRRCTEQHAIGFPTSWVDTGDEECTDLRPKESERKSK